jgi:hypothetical protein
VLDPFSVMMIAWIYPRAFAQSILRPRVLSAVAMRLWDSFVVFLQTRLRTLELVSAQRQSERAQEADLASNLQSPILVRLPIVGRSHAKVFVRDPPRRKPYLRSSRESPSFFWLKRSKKRTSVDPLPRKGGGKLSRSPSSGSSVTRTQPT